MLTTAELKYSEHYWWRTVQCQTFLDEIVILDKGGRIKNNSKLLPFHPFLDPLGLLHVGGRIDQAELFYSRRHPVLLPGIHDSVKLMINSEDGQLLHVSPTLVASSLSRNVCIQNGTRSVLTIVRSCVECRCTCISA